MIIKSIRQLAGLTQRELALRYNIPLRTIEDWEREVNNPPAYVKKMLCIDIIKSIDAENIDKEVFSKFIYSDTLKNADDDIRKAVKILYDKKRDEKKL